MKEILTVCFINILSTPMPVITGYLHSIDHL